MAWKSTAVTMGLFSFGLLAPLPALAESNVMVIFDSSGSMKRSAGNESRISAAKRVVADTLASMPEEVRTGLMTYGHRRAKDCSDIEIVSPIGDADSRTQARMVQGFDALGETPIAAALDRAGQSMSKFKGHTNSIVLVTDGIEECRGDPCAAADRLSALGIGVKVHVVGFALQPGESSALQCVVQKTGGTYFDAADAEGLRRTFAEVRKMVAQNTAKPPEPPATRGSKVVFEDQFNGGELITDWEVLNRNADRYIVEKGELMLVNPDIGGFHAKDAVNIVRLTQDMPAGDWDVVIDAKLLFQSMSDTLHIGLMTDDKNFLRTTASFTGSEGCHKLEFGIGRASGGGEETKSTKIFSGNGCGYGAFGNEDTKSFVKALDSKGVRIVLMKRDRKYSATFEIKDWTDTKQTARKITTDELTSLRAPGRLSMQVGKADPKRPSETGVRIDQVRIIAYD